MNARTMQLSNGMKVFCASTDDVKSLDEEIFRQDAPGKHGMVIRDGDVIFDLGANIGLFALWASNKCRNITIHAFEPIPSTFAILKKNVDLHTLNVKAHNIGIGGTSGMLEFTSYTHMSMLSSMKPDEEKLRTILRDGMVDAYFKVLPWPLAIIFFLVPVRRWRIGMADAMLGRLLTKRTLRCRVETLGEMIRRESIARIDLLKIDTEGNELEILESLQPAQWARIRQLIIEIHHPDSELDKIAELVRGNGFHVQVDNSAVANEGVLYMLYASRAQLTAGG